MIFQSFITWMNGLAAPLAELALKGTVLLALAFAGDFLLQRASAAARHLLWAATMTGLVILPMGVLAGPAWRVIPGWKGSFTAAVFSGWTPEASPAPVMQREDALVQESASAVKLSSRAPSPIQDPLAAQRAEEQAVTPMATTAAALPESTVNITSTITPLPGIAINLYGIFAGLWLAGSVILLIRMLRGAWHLRELERVSVAVPSSWNPSLNDCRSQCGVFRRIDLAISQQVTMPLTFGIFRARIMLPSSAHAWDYSKRHLVLLHELFHVARLDVVAQIIASVAQIFFWFHPLLWAALLRLERERERACDDRVVMATGAGRTVYAETLVEIALASIGRTPMAITGLAMARPSALEGRVRRVLDRGCRRGAVTRPGAALVIGLFVAVSGTLGALCAATAEDTKNIPTSILTTAPELVAGSLITGVPATKIVDTAHAIQKFPSGGTVEIIAVTTAGRSPAPWWTATGGPAVTEVQISRNRTYGSNIPNKKKRIILLKITGLRETASPPMFPGDQGPLPLSSNGTPEMNVPLTVENAAKNNFQLREMIADRDKLKREIEASPLGQNHPQILAMRRNEALKDDDIAQYMATYYEEGSMVRLSDPNLFIYVGTFNEDEREGTIRIGVASDTWKTLAEGTWGQSGKGEGGEFSIGKPQIFRGSVPHVSANGVDAGRGFASRGGVDNGASFGGIRGGTAFTPVDGYFSVQIAHTFDLGKIQFRAVGIDKEGKESNATEISNAGTLQGLTAQYVYFQNSKPDTFKSLRLQQRPIEWVELNHVAIEPGRAPPATSPQ